MEIVNKKLLVKFKKKNKGNISLCKAIDNLLNEFETKNWFNHEELKKDRPDADKVHNDGFYFFDLNVHRTMVLIEFDETGEASIVWCGTHQEYEKLFKNNKLSIGKWLKANGWII